MYFTFMDKSTETILDTPMMLCTFEVLDEVMGASRETEMGETSMFRSAASNYGTKYGDTLSFDYALVKEDGSTFTSEEQRRVEAWLTSPKSDRYLRLYNRDGFQNATYYGSFTNTGWKRVANGFAGITFTFQCNTSYAWQFHELEFMGLDKTSQLLTIDALSDEYEEWVYPTISMMANNLNADTSTVYFKNVTDNGNTMQINLKNQLQTTIDCKNCIIKDETNNGVIGFDDLGWSDSGRIYLPRLYPGKNKIELTMDGQTTLNMKISYMSPLKIVGGWL